MTLTAEQLETRRRYIGGSDAPAICGVDPFRNAGDVYAAKVHDLEETSSEPMEIGSAIEPMLLDFAADRLGSGIRRGAHYVHPDEILAVNLDGQLILHPEQGVEAKSSSVPDGWGDADEPNNVPLNVMVQTHLQMWVADLSVVWVPVLLGQWGLKRYLYRVDRDDELAEVVAGRCTEFMLHYVRPRVEPPDQVPGLATLKRIRRVAEKTVKIDSGLLLDAKEAHEQEKLAKREREHADAAVLAALGDAEVGECDAGRVTCKYVERRPYAVEATGYWRLNISRTKGTSQ